MNYKSIVQVLISVTLLTTSLMSKEPKEPNIVDQINASLALKQHNVGLNEHDMVMLKDLALIKALENSGNNADKGDKGAKKKLQDKLFEHCAKVMEYGLVTIVLGTGGYLVLDAVASRIPGLNYIWYFVKGSGWKVVTADPEMTFAEQCVHFMPWPF